MYIKILSLKKSLLYKYFLKLIRNISFPDRVLSTVRVDTNDSSWSKYVGLHGRAVSFIVYPPRFISLVTVSRAYNCSEAKWTKVFLMRFDPLHTAPPYWMVDRLASALVCYNVLYNYVILKILCVSHICKHMVWVRRSEFMCWNASVSYGFWHLEVGVTFFKMHNWKKVLRIQILSPDVW